LGQQKSDHCLNNPHIWQDDSINGDLLQSVGGIFILYNRHQKWADHKLYKFLYHHPNPSPFCTITFVFLCVANPWMAENWDDKFSHHI
jgi:hypothetical protein